MKKIYLLALLTALTTACSKKTPTAHITAAQLSLVIGNPVDYGFTDLLIFPVGANYNPKINENESKSSSSGLSSNSTNNNGLAFVKNYNTSKYDNRSSEEFINVSENDFDIRNILFFDKKTGQSRPLIKDTLHILSFAIHKEFKKPLIFFRIVKKDVNEDMKYNSADAVMLYVSDLDGLNFTQITPENEQFFDYFYYPETDIILIKTALDIDKSKSFTNLDETNFREMKIMAPAMGREIFSKNLKDSLKAQISAFQ